MTIQELLSPGNRGLAFVQVSGVEDGYVVFDGVSIADIDGENVDKQETARAEAAEFGVELLDYYLEPAPSVLCACNIIMLMQTGCQCGGK